MRRLAVLALCMVGAVAASAAVEWPFDMRIESCRTFSGARQVTTTGGVFDIDPLAGQVVFSQRISARRRLGVLELPPDSLRGLKQRSRNHDVAVWQSDTGLRLEVHADSVLRLTSPLPLRVRVTGNFAPEYLREGQGCALALDERGGFGVYYLADIPVHPVVAQQRDGCTIAYDLPANVPFLLSVCPPREYDWQRDATDRIAHYFPSLIGPDAGWSDHPLPSDEELTAWRKFTSVLVLHLETWDGYMVEHPKLRDAKRTWEVLGLARKLGYKTLLYISPMYYQPSYEPGWKLRSDAVDKFLAHQEWALSTFNLDGVYWDGTFLDVTKSWECARRTREMLGTRRFYFHNTFSPLSGNCMGVYCPFVDTYADYILRGETLDRRRVDPIYLRYEASGRNISNAIGTLCYDACRVDKTMVDWALEAGVRIPYWPGTQVLNGRRYGLTPEEDKCYREVYLPKLAALQGQAANEALDGAARASRDQRRKELARLETTRRAELAKYLVESKARAKKGNLAANRPCTCSDYCPRPEGLHLLGYLPEYATDNNPDTFWGADLPPVQWLSVDLGKAHSISRIVVINYHADKRFYHYRVEVSADGQTWQQVGGKLNDKLATGAGDRYTFPAVTARYVRVTMLSNSANCGVHIAELEVYR